MQLLSQFPGRATQHYLRFAEFVGANLNVGPADSAAHTHAKRLKDRFLAGPAGGEVIEGAFALLAIANFPRRVDALKKELAMPLDHAADPQTFHDVRADAEDFHNGTVVLVGFVLPADLSKVALGLYNPIFGLA
jgi:hypothetical protein